MATRTATFRFAPRAIASPSRLLRTPNPRRSFFNLPSAEPQTLAAHRTLPYSSSQLYELIADIDSYTTFLPYCTTSRVTSWSAPDPESGRRYPTAGILTAGWSGLSETYSSRVFCVPKLGIVEAISGNATSSIPASELQKYGLRDAGPGQSGSGAQEGTFSSLVTRWTVRPLEARGREEEWSRVDLSIRFQFVNPLYAAVSSAVADKVAPIMVEAFEKEARRVLGRPGGQK
ncbi:putative Dehydrase and lipid transport-domain-containing protein [Seiridium cardinale]|uniref:Dehydrase and lipid transport-domain-containing protein n=1 Tax=Seiridium cardinale TaxID=138064 RepID=A0ABR2XJ65_9PEZI